MLRKLKLTLIAIPLSFLFFQEARAFCLVACQPFQMSPQVMGYQPYYYYQPYIGYSLQVGYRPYYGYPGGGYPGYGSGYGGFPGFGLGGLNGFGGFPSYGAGGGGYSSLGNLFGVRNYPWSNNGFLSYPRYTTYLAPRYGSSTSSSYPGPRTERPSRPTVIDSIADERPAPPAAEVPAVTPSPTPEETVAAQPALPGSSGPIPADCIQIFVMDLLESDTTGARCYKRGPEWAKRNGHKYIRSYNRGESRKCFIEYIPKDDIARCEGRSTRPSAPARRGDRAAPAAEVNVSDIPQVIARPNRPSSSRPSQQNPNACGPGEVRVQGKVGACVPCKGEGQKIVNGACVCDSDYGTENLSNGGIRCFKVPAPVSPTEGDICTDCKNDSPPTPAEPQAIIDANKCEYTVAGRALKFDCVCTGKKVYPITGVNHKTDPTQYDSEFEKELGHDAVRAICLYENLRFPLSNKQHLQCDSINDAGERKGGAYCFRPEYYRDIYKAFNEAAACFGLTKSDQDNMFSFISQESKFHLDAVNAGDPSVGIGQIHYQAGRTGEELKASNRYADYPVDTACRQKFDMHRKSLGKFGAKNSSSNHMCSAIQSPEQSMFLAAAVYMAKKRAVNRYLDSSTCKSTGKKVKDSFDKIDDQLRSRLAMLAYNMGEGNLYGVLCAYAQAKAGKNSYSARSDQKGIRWNISFDTSKINSGEAEISGNTRSKPTTGFWGLVQAYYNRVNGHMNYIYAIMNRSDDVSKRAGVQCPKP